MQAAFNADLKTYRGLVKSWAISVIVKGHSVYISSTLAGGASFLYIPNANTDNKNHKYIPGNINQAADAGVLEWAPMQCQVASTSGAGHRTGANCGEMMAAMAFVRTNSAGVLDNSPVVTWGRYKAPSDQGRPTGPWIFGVMDPRRTAQGLGKAPVYGCSQATGEYCTVQSSLSLPRRAPTDGLLLDSDGASGQGNIMGVIKAWVIVCIYITCELKIGQVYCLLDRDRLLLNNSVGNRMCVQMGDCVEKRAGLTQTGDIYWNAGSVFEVYGGLISVQSMLSWGGLQGSGRIRTSEGSLSFGNVYQQLMR